ncbi:response regulator [Vreelandella populi]|uniref:response regulator n=1 Tax=Vreelandella populi TaxID=2498858 RepID=UPI000F8D921A|nr:response regulator [Halomonas populi]RUR39342.1 response regulator [Halomonas populi]
MNWNFLIIDDQEQLAQQTADIVSSQRTLKGVNGLEDGQIISCEIVSDFEEAKIKIRTSKYDLAIIDLRDEASNNDIKGKEILESLRKEQFIPVIFYSGFAHKVENLRTPFVQVLAKGDDDADLLREAVKSIFNTRLPHLVRHIQEKQREYLWDHVQNHWSNTDELKEDGELAYLLARRLSSSLTAESIRGFLNPDQEVPRIVHPVEYYIWPSLEGNISLGDIYKKDKTSDYYLVINPACDLDQGKTESALFVKCLPIEGFSEFSDVSQSKKTGSEISKSKKKQLRSLVCDNRKSQPERYKYIPGTSFMPHLIADFQHLSQEPIARITEADNYERVATLDSPFAEAIQARFARYYSRFGVPDLDFDNVTDALISKIN